MPTHADMMGHPRCFMTQKVMQSRRFAREAQRGPLAICLMTYRFAHTMERPREAVENIRRRFRTGPGCHARNSCSSRKYGQGQQADCLRH